MREGEQEVKQRDGVRLHDAEGDDVRFSVKERNQHRGGEVNRDADQLRQCDGTDNAKVCAFLCAVILLCAKVLTDKGGQRHREAGDRQKTKALDLRVGTAACHRRRPEGVDIGLHNYVCDGDDRILDAGRQTIGDDLAQYLPVDLQLFQGNAVFPGRVRQVVQAEQGA